MFNLFDNNDDSLNMYLLTFLANEFFAFALEDIVEIILPVEIFDLTINDKKTSYILYNDENIPIFDIGNYFGNSIKNNENFKKFLVLASENNKFALIVDGVDDVVKFSKEDFAEFNDGMNFFSTISYENKIVKRIKIAEFYSFLKKDTFAKIDCFSDKPTSLINSVNTLSLADNISYEISNDNFFNEKYILFELNNELYSFNIEYVKEIKKMFFSSITKIPCVPDYVEGILSFRGDYISVLDIKSFLGMQKTERKEKVDIITLKINNFKLAIVVDKALDIVSLPISNMSSDNISENSFIIGEILYENNKFVNMLNVEKLFSCENVNIENRD